MANLYHYCPASSFLSIIQHKSIWLSSLTLSNDSMEGKLLKNTFLSLFNNQDHSWEVIQRIETSINAINELIDGLGFCLSKEGDLLSQWRGYASDGEGFSIGFSENYLKALEKGFESEETGFKLLRVLYKLEEHRKSLLPIFKEIKHTIETTEISPPKMSFKNIANPEIYKIQKTEYDKSLSVIREKTLKILPQLFALKHPAFSEEKEFRLVSHLIKDSEEICQFHVVNNKIVPHKEFKLIDLGNDPIQEVIIGPKNQTPDYLIERLLSTNGFNNFTIKRSDATYR